MPGAIRHIQGSIVQQLLCYVRSTAQPEKYCSDFRCTLWFGWLLFHSNWKHRGERNGLLLSPKKHSVNANALFCIRPDTHEKKIVFFYPKRGPPLCLPASHSQGSLFFHGNIAFVKTIIPIETECTTQSAHTDQARPRTSIHPRSRTHHCKIHDGKTEQRLNPIAFIFGICVTVSNTQLQSSCSVSQTVFGRLASKFISHQCYDRHYKPCHAHLLPSNIIPSNISTFTDATLHS